MKMIKVLYFILGLIGLSCSVFEIVNVFFKIHEQHYWIALVFFIWAIVLYRIGIFWIKKFCKSVGIIGKDMSND